MRSACGRSVFGCRGGAGFTLLEMMIVLAIIGILLSVAIPNLQQARVRANESAAMAALRALHAAQTMFREGDYDRDGVPDYAVDLRELGPEVAGLIDEALASGTRQGYVFEILPGANGFDWAAIARPELPGRSGHQSFYTDATGVIRYTTSGTPDRRSLPIGD